MCGAYTFAVDAHARMWIRCGYMRASARTGSNLTSETHHPEIASHKQDLGAFWEERHSLLCSALFFSLVYERGPVFGYAFHASQCFGMIG